MGQSIRVGEDKLSPSILFFHVGRNLRYRSRQN